MADHLTEEEQIEAIKRWWHENWKSIVFPVFAAAAIYLGWNWYQADQARKASEGSAKYEVLLQTMDLQPGQKLSDEDKTTVRTTANEIISEYGSSSYADFSKMILAKLAVDDNKLDEAASLLKEVSSAGANDSTAVLARARLAKVYYAQGKLDDALGLASAPVSEAYKALYAEVRGDIFVAKGNKRKANEAFQVALASLPPQQFTRRNIIQFKLDATQVAKEQVAKESEAPSVVTGDTTNAVEAAEVTTTEVTTAEVVTTEVASDTANNVETAE